MDLDEDIRHKLKVVRMSLKFSARDHEGKAEKCRVLVSAISDFLGEQSNGPQEPEPNGYGQITDAVRSALLTLKKGRQFTVADIEGAVASVDSGTRATRQTISIVLWKMAERGELGIVERGTGRKPTIYEVRELARVRHKRT